MESAKLLWSALTSTLAAELAATSVIVNAVCPGLTATYPGAEGMGARPVAQSAAGLLWAATLPGDGRAVGSSAMDSLWTAAARDALRNRHGASIRWPHRESIA
jgi:NAD(P)-dependent dehydrogenase (short-subunit alcohol dehydrogenase family)